MDENEFDRVLGLLAQEGSAGDPDLVAGVWHRVRSLEGRAVQRRHAALTFGVGLVALVSGIGVTQRPAEAAPAPVGLFGELANSPSSLLGVSQ